MTIFTLAGILVAIFSTFLATISFLSAKNKLYGLLGLFNLSVAFWGAGCFLVGIAQNEGPALWGWKIANFGGFFISIFFYHLVCEFCGSKRTLLIMFGYIQAFAFNYLTFTTDNVITKTRFLYGLYYNDGTFPYFLAVCAYLFLVFLSYLELFLFLRRSSGERKTQALYVIVGFLFGFGLGSTTLLPSFGVTLFYPFGNFGICVYVMVIAYGIFRHHLFDVEQIIQAFQKDKLAAIGLLSASINHEIRSPLFVIKGYAETLLDRIEKGSFKLVSEEQEDGVKQILRKTIGQSERIVAIAQRLTDFSKPANVSSIEERINLDEIVENILSFVGYGLKIDNIIVEKSISPNLIFEANPKEFEQILLNLIINASQAMNKKIGKITIAAQEKDEKIEIQITDTGPGIPQDRIKSIFEPFFTTKQSGTGLGLYITKQLVERNKGKISVESKMGVGTTFILEFQK